MVSHLSEFCRLALSGGDMDILTVGKEIETIRHYLTLEQMRLGDYLQPVHSPWRRGRRP